MAERRTGLNIKEGIDGEHLYYATKAKQIGNEGTKKGIGIDDEFSNNNE